MAAQWFGSEHQGDSLFRDLVNAVEQTGLGLLGLTQGFKHEISSQRNDSAANVLPELTILTPSMVSEKNVIANNTNIPTERFELLDLALQKQQVERVQTLLDQAQSLDEASKNNVSDLIIRRDGSIVMNPMRQAQLEGTAEPKVIVSFESGDTRGGLTPEQNAALRDIIFYLRMHNPSAVYPHDWQKIFNTEMPPPMMLSENSLQVPSYSNPGNVLSVRSNDGTGFAGAGGEHSQVFSKYRNQLQNSGEEGSLTLSSHLNKSKFIDKVVHAISGNEGNFASVNRNDCGYGISIGIRQWNQKVGELPTLLRAWKSRNAHEFQEIFGSKYSEKLANESWVRNYNMAADHDLMARMDKALHNKSMQETQVELARQFVRSSVKLAQEHGFRSELGIALVCDLVNQKGSGGAKAALRRAGLQHGCEIRDERSACNQLSGVSQRQSGHARFVALQRHFSSAEAANIKTA